MNRKQTNTLAEALQRGDRSALAQAITLVESNRERDQIEADSLLVNLLPNTRDSVRVGITGMPGAGKSTLIERVGIEAITQGYKVAVLTIDPSSERSGGSILGDKTRMASLAIYPEAFVRPSPAGASSGGVASRTRECIYLCEAAGFDFVIVETIGIGQSELKVAGMTDLFVLLLLPGAGDELQGIKRGAIEFADLVLVNKADGLLRSIAATTVANYQQALRLLRPPGARLEIPVLGISALEGQGVSGVLEQIIQLHRVMRESGELKECRANQSREWLWQAIRDELLNSMVGKITLEDHVAELEQAVVKGRIPASLAARKLVRDFIWQLPGDT